jgi:UDP-N-acetylmuramoylalanine--D-glutamate ligase
MDHLKDQSVLILGLGASGLAMARWCARNGARVTVADTREAPPQLGALQAELPGAKFVSGEFTAALVEGTGIRAVFRSPGLQPATVAPVMDAARAQGLWTGGELDLFARALADIKAARGYAPAVLAITGTNGKTTVTALTGQLVERAGKTVSVAGNIGPTLLDTLALKLDEQAVADVADAEKVAAEPAAPDEKQPGVAEPEAQPESEEPEQAEVLPPEDDADTGTQLQPPPPPVPQPRVLPQVWVIELSSFQLDGVEGFEPTAATVLNVTQDHLDWHGGMEAYAAAKQRVFGESALMLLNREDPLVMKMLPEPVRIKGGKMVQRAYVTFGTDMPSRANDWGLEEINGMAWLVHALEADETQKRRKNEEEEVHFQRLMPADALRIRGRHNAANALAALALAGAAGCALGPMLYGLREYRGEPHRVEPVGIVDDVEYFDDSKGTNVGATVAALNGLGADRRVIVILGGDGKGQDFAPLAPAVAKYARAVVLIGRDGPLIRAVLEDTGVPLIDAGDMHEAVKLAGTRAHAGDAVLMSPACASFDMFDNYPHRARVFREAVAAVAEQSGHSLEGTS